MLQKFRTIDLVWDLANKNFHETIELSSSDEQGRRIVVQVLDSGQVVDLTGVGLNLYWETKDKHYMGLDNFTALDVRKGLFELYATTELLSNVGKLSSYLYLVTAEGEAITSLSLDINVNRGINTEAVESQNSFSALTEGLGRLLEIEVNEQNRIDAEAQRAQDYLVAEQNRYNLYQSAEQERESDFESRAGQLEATYAPRLTGAENNISNLTSLVGEGGIVESGENEYGYYTKLNNGWMVVVSKEVASSFNDSRSLDSLIYYAVPFVGLPYVVLPTITLTDNFDRSGTSLYTMLGTESKVVCRLHGSGFVLGESIAYMQVVAIGRWKYI